MTPRSWRAAGFENGIAAELEIDYAGRVAEPGKYVSLSLVSLTRALVGRQRFVAHALVYLRHVTALMEDVAQDETVGTDFATERTAHEAGQVEPPPMALRPVVRLCPSAEREEHVSRSQAA